VKSSSHEIVVSWYAGTETLRVVAVNVNGEAIATDDVRSPSPAIYPLDAPAGGELRVRWTILAESGGPVRIELHVRNRASGALVHLDDRAGVRRGDEAWRGEATVDAP
jgi:hypothetical protein